MYTSRIVFVPIILKIKKIEKNEFFFVSGTDYITYRTLNYIFDDVIRTYVGCGVLYVLLSLLSSLVSLLSTSFTVNFSYRGSTILILPLLLCRVFVVSQPVHCMHRPMQLIHRGPHFQQYVLLQKH